MSDATLFASVVDQMQHGRPYYDAMGDLLRHGSTEPWPTASVFNWRPPLLYWLLTLWPGRPPLVALFTEVWAGLLLWGAFLVPPSWSQTRLGVATVAVLVRELSGLAWLVLLVRSWRDRKAVILSIGILVLYYAGHWTAVLYAAQPGDLAPASWMAWGGLPFLLRTFDLAPFALLWPMWGPWLWGGVLCLVIASPRVPRELRVTIALYLLAFLVIGRSPGPQFDGNYYWGAVIIPTQILAVLVWLFTLNRGASESIPR